MIFSYVKFEGEAVPCLGVSGHHAVVLVDDEYRTVLISQVKHSHFPDEKAPKEDEHETRQGQHRARFASDHSASDHSAPDHPAPDHPARDSSARSSARDNSKKD